VQAEKERQKAAYEHKIRALEAKYAQLQAELEEVLIAVMQCCC